MSRRYKTLRAFAGGRLPIFRHVFDVMLGVLVGGLVSGVALAQEDPAVAPGKPRWSITPTVAVDLTYTDNVNPGGGQKTSDLITRVSPGIRIEGSSARASGNLTYNWQHYSYAESSARDSRQQSMAAKGKLELVEKWMFIDASGNIAQRTISAFGTQGASNELVNSNRTETSSYQLSPYLQGRLGGVADYELRYSNMQTSADTGVLSGGGTTTQAWNGRLSGATPLTLLGWSLNAERQSAEFGSTNETRTSRLYGTLEYRIDPQIRLFLNAGQESDNFSSDRRSRTTRGYGVDWAPTERTLLSLKKDRHSYGDSHSANFTHRTALSAWKLSDSRSVSLPTQQMTQAPVSSAYELLNMQLMSSIPDAAERAIAVSQMLQQAGISADALVFGNVMSSQAFVQRRQEASVALTGVNNTVTLSVQRSSSERTGTGVSLIDDFASSSRVRQSGLSGSWAHKLSPHAALTLNANTSRSSGDTASQETRLRSLSLLLTKKLGVRTSATAGLRQTSSDSAGGASYDERAVTGSILVTF